MDARRATLKKIQKQVKAREKAKRGPLTPENIMNKAVAKAKETVGEIKGLIETVPQAKKDVEKVISVYKNEIEKTEGGFKAIVQRDAKHYFKSRWIWSKDMEGLGDLYDGDYRSFNRREWRGFADTMYDFGGWLRILATLGINCAPVMPQMAVSLFRYPWMTAYLTTFNFVDRHKLGTRGNQLKYNDDQFYGIVCDTVGALVKTLERDVNLQPNSPRAAMLRENTIMFDEMNPVTIMTGFPDVAWTDIMALSVAIPGELDQAGNLYQVDISQRQGMAADVCPFPSAEVGASIVNDLPITGKAYITSSMPCDGAVGAKLFMSRHFKDIDRYVISPVQRFNDSDNSDFTVDDLRDCIAWIEEKMNTKWDWDFFWERAEEYNLTTECYLEKLDINATPYPQVCGGALSLFREAEFQIAGCMDHKMTEIDVKSNEMMIRNYEKDKANDNIEYKYRAIVWCCPAHYYTNFTSWAESTWGIRTIMDMEGMLSYHFYTIGDEEQALYDIAHSYERMMMRSHSNGGYVNALDECWRMCEKMNANIVIMYDHVGCKNFGGLHGLFEDQAAERGIHLIWVQHDLLDPRVVSRKAMRDSVNKYMANVFRAKPVDPTFVDYEDALTW